MSGRELFEILVQNSGLPEGYARSRFQKLLADNGASVETLNLDQVREMLADLLQDLINESEGLQELPE